MSTSGFEALPAREGGRHKRPRKLGAGCVSEGGAAAPAAPAHSYTVTVGAAAVAAEGAPVYDSALFSSAEREDEKPGEVEGSGGMGKWEYLDHTADVQIHTCARLRRIPPFLTATDACPHLPPSTPPPRRGRLPPRGLCAAGARHVGLYDGPALHQRGLLPRMRD
jgi:hypothetical protein